MFDQFMISIWPSKHAKSFLLNQHFCEMKVHEGSKQIKRKQTDLTFDYDGEKSFQCKKHAWLQLSLEIKVESSCMKK